MIPEDQHFILWVFFRTSIQLLTTVHSALKDHRTSIDLKGRVENSVCFQLNALPGYMLFTCITVIYCDNSTTPTDNTALLRIWGITEENSEGRGASVRRMIPHTVGEWSAGGARYWWTRCRVGPRVMCRFFGPLSMVTKSGSCGGGFMWVGPSAELRCPEEEGPARSTPSAARPWRGGWGRAGGRRTPPQADWEGSTRRCPGQRAGCRPADTGVDKCHGSEQPGRAGWYAGQGYICLGHKGCVRNRILY